MRNLTSKTINELESIASHLTGCEFVGKHDSRETLEGVIQSFYEADDVEEKTCSGFSSVTFEPRVAEYSKKYKIMDKIRPVELRQKFHINGMRSWYNNKTKTSCFKLLSITSRMRTVEKYDVSQGEIVKTKQFTMVERDIFLFARKGSMVVRAYEGKGTDRKIAREEYVGLEKIAELYKAFDFIIDYDERLTEVFSQFIIVEPTEDTKHNF